MSNTLEYYGVKRISNSLLSSLSNPRRAKKRLEEPDTELDSYALRIGSAVDCLMTDPIRFPSEFKVVTAQSPSGYMANFAANLPKGFTKDSPDEDAYMAYAKAGYKKPITWVIARFWADETAVAYYEQVIDSTDERKHLMSDEMYIVNKAVELLNANPFIKNYFFSSLYRESLRQVAIYFNINEYECKGLLDGIVIDHKNKWIQPFDLKTTSKGVMNFQNSFLDYGYYRQAAFYYLAIMSDESPVKEYIDEGYQVLPFEFVVVETNADSTFPAVIYKTTAEDLKAGLFGAKVGAKYYPGLYDLLEDYKWHMETGNWDMPRTMYANNGKLELSINYSSSN